MNPFDSESVAFVHEYLSISKRILDSLSVTDILGFVEIICTAYDNDRQVFVVGNGGSAATASHMACDLTKTVSPESARRLRVLALTDNVSLLTAWANDISYDIVFAEQLRTLARPKDVLIVISASGNSPSVVEAAKTARQLGLNSIGLLGFDGGQVRNLLDRCIVVQSQHYGHVEDQHLLLNHLVTAYLRELLFLRQVAEPPVASIVGGLRRD